MGVSLRRRKILDAARSYIGVPWRHQGRSREHGIDCVGLPLMVGIDLGYMEEELKPANYPRRPTNEFIPLFREYLDVVFPADQQPGDILVFADSGHPCHCGILSEKFTVPSVIHAHANDRMVIEQPLSVTSSFLGKPVYRFKYKGLK